MAFTDTPYVQTSFNIQSRECTLIGLASVSSDTAAILNLLDLRGIMRCSGGGGVLVQYLGALLGQKRTSLYISCGKANIMTSKHGTSIFFSSYE